jgi:hypothetical protein
MLKELFILWQVMTPLAFIGIHLYRYLAEYEKSEMMVYWLNRERNEYIILLSSIPILQIVLIGYTVIHIFWPVPKKPSWLYNLYYSIMSK